MKNEKNIMDYSAKHRYNDPESIKLYEADRFSGFLGKYRWNREQNAISAILEGLGKELTICDCPCGNGRWWPHISEHASKIVAIDNSDEMLHFAAKRSNTIDADVELLQGKAEQLDLPDNSVDYLFSHALTKHLPIPVQYAVLKEFARVSRKGVICSFGIFTHMSYEFWRRRKLEESYPVFYEELVWMAAASGLKIVKKIRCTTPMGVENTVLFEKENRS